MSERAFSSLLPEVHFGVFTVDLRAGELRKNGTRVKLQERPFQILVLLLERPGEVLTREELRSRLWPQGTFVDFDHSISSAIQKLRTALCDSASTPRYIETVGRRGYRFVYPVEHAAKVVSIDRLAERNHPPEAVSTPLPAPQPVPMPERAALGKRHRWLWLAAAIVTLFIAAAIAHSCSSSSPAPTVLRIVQLTHSGQVHSNQNLVTDGPLLYYEEGAGLHPSLKSVAVAGGEPVSLPSPLPAYDLQDISPNGAEMLIRNLEHLEESELWSVPLPGGSPHRIGGIWGHDFTYAPDGRRIGFTKGRAIYVANADGSGVRKLADVPGNPYMLRWSPRGDLLRFTLIEDASGRSRLWQVSTSGQAGPMLPDGAGPSSQSAGNWTPDGKFFVFSSQDEGQRDVWVLREGAGWGAKRAAMPLTRGPMTFWRPTVSRDGRRILTLGWQARGELTAYDPAARRYEPFLQGISAEFVSFSPDRQFIVYVRYPDATVWRARADGSGEPRQLTFPPLHAMIPRWSPDGKQILFSARTNNADWRIYVVGADGDGLQRVVPDETPQQFADWSPDGAQIVFGNPPAQPDSSGHLRLYLLNRNDNKVRALPGGEDLWAPVWSPDGRWIAATTAQTEQQFCLDPRTGAKRLLSTIGGSAVWSPDSRFLFLADFEHARGVFRVNIADGTEQTVWNDTTFHNTGRVGLWFTIAPDGRVLSLRDRTSFDIYAIDWDPR